MREVFCFWKKEIKTLNSHSNSGFSNIPASFIRILSVNLSFYVALYESSRAIRTADIHTYCIVFTSYHLSHLLFSCNSRLCTETYVGPSSSNSRNIISASYRVACS